MMLNVYFILKNESTTGVILCYDLFSIIALKLSSIIIDPYIYLPICFSIDFNYFPYLFVICLIKIKNKINNLLNKDKILQN